MAYEKKFGRWIRKKADGRLYLSQWLWFQDANGFGFAQPDAFLLQPEGILLLECKLSYRDRAWDQLRGLYAPLLEALFGLPAACVQVTKYVPRGIDVCTCWPPGDGATFLWLPP